MECVLHHSIIIWFGRLFLESHKFKHLVKESLLVIKDKPLLRKQGKSLKLEIF